MSPDTDHSGHVLVVDDEHAVAATQALRIETTYGTSVAYGGEGTRASSSC